MAVCIGALYREFPEIKAFGCCHEVFGTQKLLSNALDDVCGIKNAARREICVNVVGINHFTWFTKAQYRNIDLFEVYRQFVDKYYKTGYYTRTAESRSNSPFGSGARVRFDLFRRFGYIAAAGDRHLAEFLDKDDYLSSPEAVERWMFELTPVSWRRADREKRIAKSKRLLSGEEKFVLHKSGEEGVLQMRALLGLDTLITNVNLPNVGQIPNLEPGVIVETNATFRANMLSPVQSGNIPESIYPYVSRTAEENSRAIDAACSRDKEYAYKVFAEGHLLTGLDMRQRRQLFDIMFENTKEYLPEFR
jgi:alpha-galactosidase